MIEQDTIKLLRECDAGIKMGISSIDDVLDRVHSETFEVGRVIRTEPEAGAVMKLGETVTIYASIGPSLGSVAVPDFSKLTEVQTLQKLSDCGLRVGTVTYEPSGYAAGTVISQSIKATTIVHANTAIDFVVSGGPGYVDPSKPVEKPAEETKPAETTASTENNTGKKPQNSETEPPSPIPQMPVIPGLPDGWENGFFGGN